MDGVVVRKATNEDYKDIVRISEGIYEGYDHLIDIYLTCLENPNRCAQVAEWNGEVVAFSAVLVVDSGRTAILQFGRCAEKARGKGIFHKLILREFAEFVYPKFPHIIRMRTSSTNTDLWDSKTDGTTIDMRRKIICLSAEPVPYVDFVRRLTPQRMVALRQQLPIDSLSPADANTLNVIMADPVSKKHLFPEGIIVSDSVIFDANKCNTSMIMQSCMACFATGSASSMYTSFSFRHAHTCPLGRHYMIDYYGTKDDSMILAHISCHLQLAPEILKKQSLLICLYVNIACGGEETKRRCHGFAAATIAPHGSPPLYLDMYSMTHPLPIPNSQL